MSVLVVENLGIGFGGLTALDDVNFAVEPGEIFAVIGPNGAGKTTLFNLISGIYVPQRGRVILGGTDVTGWPPHRLARRGLSRTFQNLQVFFRMSVVENVMVGRHQHESHNVLAHLFTLPGAMAQDRRTRLRALELLDVVGLAGVADRLLALWRVEAARDRPRARHRADAIAARRAGGRLQSGGKRGDRCGHPAGRRRRRHGRAGRARHAHGHEDFQPHPRARRRPHIDAG